MENIGGSSEDASYRYKMPKLTTKIEGRGNGIKTVLPNMTEVAKALHCPPAYPTKFFGVELGAQSKYTESTERAVVNGAHNSADLQVLLRKFIEIFILCPNCSLPETVMKVKKSSIKIDCAACGYNGVLATTHKLVTYMLKHPPAKKKRSEGEKSKKKKESEATSSAVKVKKKDVVWLTDTSQEAVTARQIEELASTDANALDERVDAIIQMTETDLKIETLSPAQVLCDFLTSKKSIDDSEIVSEIRRLELARNLSMDEQLVALVDGIVVSCGDSVALTAVTERIEQYSSLLQKYPSKQLWGAFEKVIGVMYSDVLMLRTPLILQTLYDNDIMEEEDILEWHQSPPEASWLVGAVIGKELRQLASPIVEWLQNAEEEE